MTEESYSINWKLPAILGLSCIALILIALFLEFKHKPAQEKAEELSKKLVQIAPEDQIAKIELSTGKAIHVMECQELSKKGCKIGDSATWKVRSANSSGLLKADSSNINSLINALEGLQFSESIDLSAEPVDKQTQLLHDYGLDPSLRASPAAKRIRLSLQTSDGQAFERTLTFGNSNPVGDALFTFSERSNEPPKTVAYLAPSYFKANFDRDLTYWREKRLFQFTATDVSAFSVRGPKSQMAGVVDGVLQDGGWWIKEKRDSVAGDSENIEAFLSAISSINARDFASEDKNAPDARKTLAGKTPLIRASFTLKKKSDQKEDPKPVQVDFYDFGKKAYVTASSESGLFEVDASLKDRLNKGWNDLRASKLLTTAERFSTQVVEISGKGFSKPLRFVNRDAQWKSPDSPDLLVDKIPGIIEKMSGNRIKEFVAGKGTLTPGESIDLTLGDEKNPSKRTYRVAKRGSEVWVIDLGSKRNEILKVDPALASVLPLPPNKEGPEFFRKGDTR